MLPRHTLLPFLLLWTSREVQGQREALAYTPLPRPHLTIGAEGNPDYEFQAIAAVVRLASGEIVVADSRSPTIRIFDSTGRFARRMGRQGAGPGEFRAVHNLFLAADTLIAYDWHLRRLTWLLSSGSVVRTQSVQASPTDGPVDLVGRLANGRWAVTTPHTPSWSHGPGVYRDTLRVGSIAPSTRGPVRWLGTYPGMTIFAYMPSEDKTRWVVGRLPIAPTTYVRVLGDTILVGDTGALELNYLVPNSPIHPLPLPIGAPLDLHRHREAERDRALAEQRDPRSKPYVLAASEVSRPQPRYRDFIVSSDRRVWLRLFGESPGDSTRYVVLTPDGRVAMRVSLGPDSEVLGVQPPWVLAVVSDADDVEHVAVMRLPGH